MASHNGRTTYTLGHVFDVSQTTATAADLPDIFSNCWLEGNVAHYDAFESAMHRIAKDEGVKIVSPRRKLGAAKGVYDPLDHAIALNPRNSQQQNVKTLLHELAAHAKLHQRNEPGFTLSSTEKDFQAEMVAYSVASYFGMEKPIEVYSQYLHYWTQGKELKDHQQLLKGVSETSVVFIETMEKALQNNKQILRKNEHLQEKFAVYTVFVNGQTKKIVDMEPAAFDQLFTNKDGQHILDHAEIRGKSAAETVRWSNQLAHNWWGESSLDSSLKIIDPQAKDPQAFIERSESADFNHHRQTMSVQQKDMLLAKKNVHTLPEIYYEKTHVWIMNPREGQEILRIDALMWGMGITMIYGYIWLQMGRHTITCFPIPSVIISQISTAWTM